MLLVTVAAGAEEEAAGPVRDAALPSGHCIKAQGLFRTPYLTLDN